MMQNPNADLNTMLPFLVLDDGKRDMKSLFLLTTVMQNNCHDTNDQMNMLLPLLLLSDDEETTDRKRRDTTDDKDNSETLMTLLLLQTMSQGNRGLDMNVMLPFLLMDDASDKDNLLLLVLVNSMTGGMDTTAGFDNNFNLLLPLLLINDDDTTADDNKESDSDMLFILLAMQSQAPGKKLKTEGFNVPSKIRFYTNLNIFRYCHELKCFIATSFDGLLVKQRTTYYVHGHDGKSTMWSSHAYCCPTNLLDSIILETK